MDGCPVRVARNWEFVVEICVMLSAGAILNLNELCGRNVETQGRWPKYLCDCPLPDAIDQKERSMYVCVYKCTYHCHHGKTAVMSPDKVRPIEGWAVVKNIWRADKTEQRVGIKVKVVEDIFVFWAAHISFPITVIPPRKPGSLNLFSPRTTCFNDAETRNPWFQDVRQ